MARFKDTQWNLHTKQDGEIATTDGAILAVLMDIRDEMKQLNRLLGCPNFTRVPWELGEIRKAVRAKRRTPKRKK